MSGIQPKGRVCPATQGVTNQQRHLYRRDNHSRETGLDTDPSLGSTPRIQQDQPPACLQISLVRFGFGDVGDEFGFEGVEAGVFAAVDILPGRVETRAVAGHPEEFQ